VYNKVIRFCTYICILFFFFFFVFCLSRAAPVAYGWGSNRSCSHPPTPQPQQHRIWTESATYTTAHGNAGSLTHWARPGIEPTTSWFLDSLTPEPWRELPVFFFRFFSIIGYYKLEYSSLYYIVGPCWFSVLYIVVGMFIKKFFFCYLWPHPQQMEVPRTGVELEPQFLAYTTAPAMQDPSLICDLCHSSPQC